MRTLIKRISGTGGGTTEVDRYWGDHTVNSTSFESVHDSLDYLEWRFAEYPMFRELTGLWGEHDGEAILDYGCGPGNDVTGFAVHTGAREIIGADVSGKALELARTRLDLHGVDAGRVRLISLSDREPNTGLADDSIDYAQSFGVLHHVSDPAGCLRELRRVLKPGAEARIMVYNHDSVWLHLYVAYIKQILEGAYAGMGVREAFAKTTDGEDCPIANCYTPAEWGAICREAGFESEFAGGYLSRHELDCLRDHGEAARADERLAPEHRSFLDQLSYDDDGNPLWNGVYAGIGGVYTLG